MAIAQMCAPDTLLLCLAEAGIEPEIIADVAEAVELSAVDALTLAANVVPTDTLAELAFLTATEAKVRALPRALRSPSFAARVALAPE